MLMEQEEHDAIHQAANELDKILLKFPPVDRAALLEWLGWGYSGNGKATLRGTPCPYCICTP